MNMRKCLICVVLVFAASLFATASAAVINNNSTLDGLWTDPGFLGLIVFGLVMFVSSLKLSLKKNLVWLTATITTSFMFLITVMLVDMSLISVGGFGVISTIGVFTLFTLIGMLRVIEVSFVTAHKLSFRMHDISHSAKAL